MPRPFQEPGLLPTPFQGSVFLPPWKLGFSSGLLLFLDSLENPLPWPVASAPLELRLCFGVLSRFPTLIISVFLKRNGSFGTALTSLHSDWEVSPPWTLFPLSSVTCCFNRALLMVGHHLWTQWKRNQRIVGCPCHWFLRRDTEAVSTVPSANIKRWKSQCHLRMKESQG